MHMTDQDIINAINRAKQGVGKYLAIMDQLFLVDVSADKGFQTQYKGFYRVRQKTDAWYATYFGLLEQSKLNKPAFAFVLNELRERLGNNAYEPSFSSKLVATLNPWCPVWDEHVLRNTGHQPPAYTSGTKHEEAVAAYRSIVEWYLEFMGSSEGRRWVCLFNDNILNYYKITDIKKIDFILWQTRTSNA
jgi:hypothetical protein